MRKAFLNIVLASGLAILGHSANAIQGVFESVVQYNMPNASVADVCAGIRTGASSFYNCGTLSNDAKRACDGIFSGISRIYTCNGLDPKTQKSSRDICDGLFWGALSSYSCNQLTPRIPNPKPEDFLAKETCDAMYRARFNPNSCHQLANQRPQVMALCNRINTWNPSVAICK